MSESASVIIVLVSSLYLFFTARFWYIAHKRNILRETLDYFHYEAVIDFVLFALCGLQLYLLFRFYSGVETPYDWAYSYGGFIVFAILASKKVDRISINGVAHAHAMSSEFDKVMDGIEIKKKFREYMNGGNK